MILFVTDTIRIVLDRIQIRCAQCCDRATSFHSHYRICVGPKVCVDDRVCAYSGGAAGGTRKSFVFGSGLTNALYNIQTFPRRPKEGVDLITAFAAGACAAKHRRVRGGANCVT